MNFLRRSSPKQAWTASHSQKAEIQYLSGVDSTSPLAPAYLKVAGVTNLDVHQTALHRAHRFFSSKGALLPTRYSPLADYQRVRIIDAGTRTTLVWPRELAAVQSLKNGRQSDSREGNRVHVEWALVCRSHDNHRDSTPAGAHSYSLFL